MEKRQTSRPAEDAHRRLDPSCFQAPRASAEPDGPRTSEEKDLHVCPTCASELVYPVTWSMVDRKHWDVSLRCPECQWEDSGTYGQDVLESFDEVLDQGTEEMVEDLKVLTRANMEDDIERFVDALNADQILPEDF